MGLLSPCVGTPGHPCGIPAPAGGCPVHRRELERAHHNPQYDDPRYRAFRTAFIAEHRRKFGNWCPGDGSEHPGHVSSDLTLDHPRALAHGGALFDRSNARVLCKARNSALGGTLRGIGVPNSPESGSPQALAPGPLVLDSVTLRLGRR